MNIRRLATAALAGLTLAAAGAFVAPSTALEVGDLAVGCGATGDVCSGDTAVQLTVTGGGTLSISVPTPASGTRVNLGSFAAGAVAAASSSLGTVTVDDTRTGILNNNWIVSASATDLILTGKTSETAAVNEMIPAASLGYTVGTITPTVPETTIATPTGVGAASLALPAPVVTTVSLGANKMVWNPKLAVTVLPTTVAGVYTGTVTHSAL